MKRNARVLVVEDERIVAMDLQQTLAAMGYDAYAIASSAAEALRHVTAQRPDIVLMDIRIKGDIDGIDTANILVQRFGLPVIFLTAHADESTIARATSTSPYGYLLKPVRATELRSTIDIALHRRDLEQKVRESERWFSTTLRGLHDAVITVGVDCRVTFMNEAAENLVGVTMQDALGKRACDVTRVATCPLEQILRDGVPAVLAETELVHTNGSVFAIAYSTSLVQRDGVLLGAVVTFRDITQQRQLKQQLESTDRLVSLGTMAAGVAHEINNPLAVLMGNVRFASDRLSGMRPSATPATQKEIAVTLEALDDSRSAIERISSITGDLQLFARRKPKLPTSVNLQSVIDWAVRATAHALRMKARLTVEIGDVPAVLGDEHRLGQVFVNLLLNASQAIDSGAYTNNHVHIRGRALDVETIAIEVIDTGCGMPPNVLARAFEPFFTTKPAGVGTGLGLSICHGIVTEHGGSISARSAVGRGTTMTVTLRTPPHEAIEAGRAVV